VREITEGRSNTGADEKAAAQAFSESADTASKPKEETEEPGQAKDEPPFRLPPVTAIAGVLIRDWAEEQIGFPREEVQKGNL